MIAILDYGIGNVSSIKNMLKRIGVQSGITADNALIGSAEKIILPGVGHFDYCMKQLRAAPFYDLLQQRVLEEKVPILGVCVGCQMLMENSEEGNEPGLGWIEGKVVKFDMQKLPEGYKVPNMGWLDVDPRETSLFREIDEPRFYFTHSYHVQCAPAFISSTAVYGYEFAASVSMNNITGVQFHPEKSHRYGMKLYNNFVNA